MDRVPVSETLKGGIFFHLHHPHFTSTSENNLITPPPREPERDIAAVNETVSSTMAVILQNETSDSRPRSSRYLVLEHAAWAIHPIHAFIQESGGSITLRLRGAGCHSALPACQYQGHQML